MPGAPLELELERTLRDFDRRATLVSTAPQREVWRFEYDGRPYYLHFYSRRRGLARLTGMGSALGEFVNLQAMQRAGVPVPRASGHLGGFTINGRLGDAVIVAAVLGAVQLDRFLIDAHAHGHAVPNRRDIARQVVEIVNQIGRAKFGHRDLGLHSFLVAEGKVWLHDVRGLRGGGLRADDVLRFAHDAAPFATRTELRRAWEALSPDLPWLRTNPLSPRLWRRFVRQTSGENELFGRIDVGPWHGHFVKSPLRMAAPWSLASSLRVGHAEWEQVWPELLARVERGELTTVKSDPAGTILSGQIVLAGRPIEVMIKRPGRKFLYRYVTDLVRPSRGMRIWRNAWRLLARGIPSEWPLLVMKRRVMGYVADSMVLFERVPGEMLDRIDLDAMTPSDRQTLFRRAGRSLRRLEQTGLAHTDAKSTNWIVYQAPGSPEAGGGPLPVVIDLYGIRPLTYFLQLMGIRRLLRAMKLHPQYTPADSLAICQGFAPHAGRFVQEEAETPSDVHHRHDPRPSES